MSSQIADLSVAQLRKAITIKERLAKLEKKLAAILGTPTSSSAPVEGTVRRRNKMSAAGRASIAAAQKARWAKLKSGKTATAEPVKKKRKMSAAGRRAIAEGARKRWAKVNAEKARK